MSHDIETKGTNQRSPFEDIRKVNNVGNEYWESRDLADVLGYTQYRNFEAVIEKARLSCFNSGHRIDDHFADVSKMVTIGSGAAREIKVTLLSRYACYLVIQNADPKKEIVAHGQTYFAVQTRRQELEDERMEEERRLMLREEMRVHNTKLADAANLFRATQAEEKLKRDQVKGKDAANKTHHAVGAKVRQTIKELGGTMPEDLPVVDSIKPIENKQKKLTGKPKAISALKGK